MKKIGVVVLVLSLVTLLFASPSFAQEGRRWEGRGGPGQPGGVNRMFDPKTVESISGEVVSVDQVSLMGGRYTGIYLKLKTEKDTTTVHLGPSWFIEKQSPKIEKNDKLEITGSRIVYDGKQVLIAAEVRKGDTTLKLRDEKGSPAWRGERRGR